MSATVSIPLTEFQGLQNEVGTANERAAALARQIDELRANTRSEDITQILDLIRAATPGMQHAIAELGAEISAWPTKALHAWSALVKLTAGTTDGHTDELALTIEDFARECEKAQALRAARKAAMI